MYQLAIYIKQYEYLLLTANFSIERGAKHSRGSLKQGIWGHSPSEAILFCKIPDLECIKFSTSRMLKLCGKELTKVVPVVWWMQLFSI